MQKRSLIDSSSSLSVQRQCDVIGLNRSTLYYQPAGETDFNLKLMRLMDEQYLRTPFYGVGQMTAWLQRQGYQVNEKRIRRLLRKMGLEALCPKPSLSKVNREHMIYPYLLRGITAGTVNHIWSTDITYLPMEKGFMYLVAVIDWYSRYVLSWELSNTLETGFCITALKQALEQYGAPQLFNTDQGSQFTSPQFTAVLKEKGIAISMDGKGRATDNVFVERLWRSLKYAYIYLNVPESVTELYKGLKNYFTFYNTERAHTSLNKKTPAEVHFNRIVNPIFTSDSANKS